MRHAAVRVYVVEAVAKIYCGLWSYAQRVQLIADDLPSCICKHDSTFQLGCTCVQAHQAKQIGERAKMCMAVFSSSSRVLVPDILPRVH